MENKELMERFEKKEIFFSISDLNRWIHFYQSCLVEEVYAVRTAIIFLTWLESKRDYPLDLSSEKITNASKTLKQMAALRHKNEELNDGDYNALIEKTADDFFGGLYLRDLVYTLDTLASLMSSDQDQQGENPRS